MKTTRTIKLIAVLCLFINIETFAQTLPENRTVNWTNSGLLQEIEEPSQIVFVTDFGATGNGFTNDSPAIQEALDELNGNPGILFFPEGNYLLSQSITTYSGLIIRGDGAQETHLKFSLSSDNQNAINISASQSDDYQLVLAGYEKGSHSIIICSYENLEVGDFLEMRQDNGGWDTEPISWAEKSVGQILQISQINGNEIILEHALRYTYDASLNPEIRKIDPISNVKVENLKIERLDEPSDGGGKNIYFGYAVNCQISGVESLKSQGSHIYLTNSSNIYLFGNYIHDAFLYDGTATRGYGVTLNRHTGEVLVENNIFRNLRHAMMVKTGANGNVFTYNYSREPHRSEPISNYSGDISVHGHYAYANLFEENICQNIIIDHYWGPGGPHNTFVRNRTELFGLIMTSNSTLETTNQNFVGNEIVGNFPYGFYSLTGSGHWEYGNNDGGTAIPAGSEDFDDTSYYYSERPWFLESSYPFPAIGYPHSLNQWSNPAKDRYMSGGTMTVEIDFSVGVSEVISFNNQIQILNNPVKQLLKLRFSKNTIIHHYRIYSITGNEVLNGQLPVHIHDIEIPVSQLSSNVYLIEISSATGREVLKFYKE